MNDLNKKFISTPTAEKRKMSTRRKQSHALRDLLMLTLSSHVHRWEDRSLSIVRAVFGQHCTVPVIGIATYPRATFGFSMIATVALHREHIIVFP